MACIQPYWWCNQCGSQHLARQFARNGYDVHYFSAPITPLHLLKIQTPLVWQRFKNTIHNPVSNEKDGLLSYIPFSLIAPDGVPGLNAHLITDHWHKTMLPPVKRYLKRHTINHVNILYIDNLSYHFLPEFVTFDKCIFRVMDMHDHFPGWYGKTSRMARRLAARADITVYSANSLKKYVENLAPRKSAVAPNGVDYDLFATCQTGSRHHLLNAIPDPLVLFVGIIDIRFDFKLIRYAARMLPHVSFVIAGPRASGIKPTGLPDNVFFIGPVPHSDLPLLMRSARAGLIPFDVKNQMGLIQGIRPLKLLEYMAAGLPVISARWPEVENMQSPAWFYNDLETFVALVQRAVAQKHGSTPFQEYARQHDWSNAWKLIEQHVSYTAHHQQSHFSP